MNPKGSTFLEAWKSNKIIINAETKATLSDIESHQNKTWTLQNFKTFPVFHGMGAHFHRLLIDSNNVFVFIGRHVLQFQDITRKANINVHFLNQSEKYTA